MLGLNLAPSASRSHGGLNAQEVTVHHETRNVAASTQPDMIGAGSAQTLSPKTLIRTNTDFGTDCDDQKAISELIANLTPNQETMYVVGGPHPRLAALAIAEATHVKTGAYPLIALGEKNESSLIPENEIFSLVDGKPMHERTIPGFATTSLAQLNDLLSEKITTGQVAELHLNVLSPLRTVEEAYDATAKISNDESFKRAWENIPKHATIQFQRLPDGTFLGNNAGKSLKGLPERYDDNLAQTRVRRTYIDGAIAKNQKLQIKVRQEQLPGIENAARTYLKHMQLAWASFPGVPGTTPAAKDMHVDMFLNSARVPFGAHVSGAVAAGFGRERLLREVCGISPESPEYRKNSELLNQQLNRSDERVLNDYKNLHPDEEDIQALTLSQLRNQMYEAMMAQLQHYAAEGTTLHSFAEYFEQQARLKNRFNPYTFMNEFMKKAPLQNGLDEISKLAEMHSTVSQSNAQNYQEAMVDILSKTGARATVYDAVALNAARVVREHASLTEHFTEADGAVNITDRAVKSLEHGNPHLYNVFINGIRDGLKRDHAQLAIE